MSHRRTTLFVAGIGSRTRARDLAYEFERYGRLVRCDIPAPRGMSAKPYAFVEFEDARDAEDAYYEMQGRKVDGYQLNIQWAKNAPSRNWRYDDRRERSRSPRRRRSRSRSPARRRSRSPPVRAEREERRRSRSRSRDRNDRDDRREDRGDALRDTKHDDDRMKHESPVKRDRSPTPERNGHRSPSPHRDDEERGRRSPSPRD